MDVVVLPGSWLASSAARVSPAVRRISLPGACPSKAQVLTMTPPPRSSLTGVAVRLRLCTLPVDERFFSTRVTAEPEGLTRPGALPEPEALSQAASAPAPAAPSPASRMDRRLMLFTEMVSLSRYAVQITRGHGSSPRRWAGTGGHGARPKCANEKGESGGQAVRAPPCRRNRARRRVHAGRRRFRRATSQAVP